MSPARRKTPCSIAVRFLLSLALIAMLSGCQDPIRAKITGTWNIEQADKVTRRVNQEERGDETEIEDIGERMVLTFYASGALLTKTKIGQLQSEKKGWWKLVQFDEKDSKMTLQCELAGQKTEHEVRFIEDDLIRLVPPNMAGVPTKINFRRR